VWLVISVYLLLVFALPVVIGGAISYRGLPRGRACPHCRNDTLQLLAPALRRGSTVLPRTVLQRRWCMSCGWEGTIMLPRIEIGVAGARPHRGEPKRGEPGRPRAPRARPSLDAPAAPRDERMTRHQSRPKETTRRATQTLDVRSLTLDGTPWRVMLQCWRNPECYYGRFVFVAPSGRLWLDSIEAFTGASEDEVLGQALSLPDGLLANRLRRLVTD
jgi:hypothetical protein